MGAYAEEQQRTKKGGPPEVGKLAGARVDELCYEDLLILARAGMNTTDAIRWSLTQMANAINAAWVRGACPEGTMPKITMWVGPPEEKPKTDEEAA
ncbi:hypothetical protein PV336_16245 [Streptomyces sp. MI02-2A]|uniref:hypothetical protein n=1 Tax=Streptomyces sp. MI02-2A TaxID=3028688 RepID=UPI0029B9FD75|nr:hypothetical protein [Streptomyces sp. MI02-2A]MDX3260772.1 hypothetical protein [Streptomyces sp. MI02-2A]